MWNEKSQTHTYLGYRGGLKNGEVALIRDRINEVTGDISINNTNVSFF